jgi:DNA-binding LacI/PurR family transcriptional regulator
VDNSTGKVMWDDVEALFQLDPFPTAVIAMDEFLVDVIIKGCLRRNIEVPRDLSIATIQDLWAGRHGIGITSTCDFDVVSRVAYEGADLLIKRMEGRGEPHILKLAPHLMKRDSTAAPRADLVLEGGRS